jgi:hypothetical protein
MILLLLLPLIYLGLWFLLAYILYRIAKFISERPPV